MSQKTTVIIHPQSKQEFFLYCGVIRNHASTLSKLVLFCREDFIHTVRFMYKDLSNVEVFALDKIRACNNDVLYAFNVINKQFKNCEVIGYGVFDRLRKDSYKNKHTLACANRTMRSCLFEYDWDESVVDAFTFTRSYFDENKLTKLFASYLNISYVIVSDDKFLKIPTDCPKINILKLFPKNRNVFNYIELIVKSDGIIVGNDEIACLVHKLQSCTSILGSKKRVRFHYKETDDISLYSNPVIKSWSWIVQKE